MRTYINLVEHDSALNRIWQNARTLQSEIKYLNVSQDVKSKLLLSMQRVTDYLDALHT
jgi:hypothetical protein